MLYLVGLGLNVDGISKFGLEVVKKCKKVYLENYTVDFPYALSELLEVLGMKKIEYADREKVENLSIVDEAKKMDVALLVYGNPLMATTHITLVQEARACNIKYRIVHSGSVLDAVAETGLQVYKFGKIASMPEWNPEKHFTPDSFMEIVQENQSIGAHSLILIDIGLKFQDALKQLEESAKNHNFKRGKLVVCQHLGTNRTKILYRDVEKLKQYHGIKSPYCMIIPGKLHFVEKEFLKEFEE